MNAECNCSTDRVESDAAIPWFRCLQEAQELNESLRSAHELNDDLSEQCAQAESKVVRQDALITELQATANAQVNEIESLGTAYAMKAQALEDLHVTSQAEKLAAERTAARKEAELLDRDNEIATLKV